MIPKAVAIRLLGLSQAVLSHIELGQNFDAKLSLLRMAAIIDIETDRSGEVEKWKAAGSSFS